MKKNTDTSLIANINRQGEPATIDLGRRKVMRYSLISIAGLISTQLVGCDTVPEGDLLPPDENGLSLLPGFTSRIVAESRSTVAGSSYVWHGSPDGGETFATPDGGWIYVSNSELAAEAGGVGAIRFAADGTIVDAYPILQETNRNCAGGKTPWGTWLSCEEDGDNGRVFECDPFGINPAVELPALGKCNHEAVAVDNVKQQLYLTEDVSDGRLYRFTPDAYPDLSTGTLEAAEFAPDFGSVTWHIVPDPSASSQSMRSQVPSTTRFDGGEGIIFRDGVVYFTTKGDDRVWAYDTDTEELTIIYDAGSFSSPLLTGVDNIVAAPSGELFVAEDGGNMQVVAIREDGSVYPFVQVMSQPLSEVCGPAFSPDRTRFYFSSQRGKTGNLYSGGITYEITGPFV